MSSLGLDFADELLVGLENVDKETACLLCFVEHVSECLNERLLLVTGLSIDFVYEEFVQEGVFPKKRAR